MRFPTVLQQRRVVITALGVAAGLLAVGAATQAIARPVIPTTEPWPPFTMVFQATEIQFDPGTGAPRGQLTGRYRLEYTDRRHWKFTVLASDSPADAIGSTSEFAGDRMISSNSKYGSRRETLYRPDQQPVLTEWLGPDRLESLAAKPNAKGIRALGNGLAVLVQEDTGLDRAGRPVVSRREIVHRVADGIPTRMTETADGQELRRWEVIDLQVGKRP